MHRRESYSFRPHHFLCTVSFRGAGYSPEFVKSYATLASKLREADGGDEVVIRVVLGPDAICDFCPRQRDGVCDEQEKVALLDEAHSKVLGIVHGELLTWGEAKRLLIDRMTLERFHGSCSSCEWKKLRVCEEALLALREEACAGVVPE